MKKIIAIALVLSLTLCCFAACGASKKIVGAWECTTAGSAYNGFTFTFNEGGTGTVRANTGDALGVLGDLIDSAAEVTMTYSIEKKIITINYESSILGIDITTASYEMAFKGDTLTLTNTADSSVLSFTKQAA